MAARTEQRDRGGLGTDGMAPGASSDSGAQARRDDLCIHIFVVSATLIGVCLTVIGVLNLVQGIQNVRLITDQMLSIDAVGFLIACTLAYSAVRTDNVSRRRRLERAADIAFLSAIVVMTAVGGIIAMELF